MTDRDPSTVDRIERTVQHCYSTWGASYYKDYYGPDASYPPVHLDLARRIVDRAAPKHLLDAGCGPASMLRHLTAPGREVYGFDLTSEMVAEAVRVMQDLGVPPQHIWQGSVLSPEDYVVPGHGDLFFDAILCSGVLPHLDDAMTSSCIANFHRALRPGGYAIVEARNELFSLFTMNRYSHRFFLDRLLPVEAMTRQAGIEQAGLQQALQQVEAMFRTDLPPLRKGKVGEPGYDEVLSRNHNPLELKEKFEAAGFQDVRLMFYHFHALPPMVADSAPQLFRKVSLQMEENPEDWRGMFMASAFFVVAQRA